MFNSFFVEHFYNIPGLGSWFLSSLIVFTEYTIFIYIDAFVIIPISYFYLFLGLTASFLLDLLYKKMDPRMQIGSKK